MPSPVPVTLLVGSPGDKEPKEAIGLYEKGIMACRSAPE